MPLNPVNGTPDNDYLFCTDDDDLVLAGTGNDVVFGRNGNDQIFGEDGDDSIDAGSGGDTVDGGSGNDDIRVSTFADFSTLADTVYAGTGDDRVVAWYYWFTATGSVFHGDDGDDLLQVNFTNTPGQSAVFDATAGTGGLTGGTAASFTFDGFERYSIYAEMGDDTITTGNGDDNIYVHRGANTVNAGGGNDKVTIVTDSVNTIDGGSGSDTLALEMVTSFDGRGAVATDSFGSNYSGFESYIISGFDFFISTVHLGSGDDIFYGRGTAYGYDGDDQLNGSIYRDTLDGGDGDDEIFGGRGNDLLIGGAGNDVIRSGDGDDIVRGGDGNDILEMGSGQNERMYGDAGNDRLEIVSSMAGHVAGGTGLDTLVMYHYGATGAVFNLLNATGNSTSFTYSSLERLYFVADRGNDIVTGGNFEDYIFVANGANVVNAGNGGDTVSYFTAQANTLDGGDGVDTLNVSFTVPGSNLVVTGTTATDNLGSLISNFENYNVSGTSYDDVVVLGDGKDTFFGGFGNDDATGGGGQDTLDGGFGNDTLRGGDGNDKLRGGAEDDHLIGGSGRDALAGGIGTDTLEGGADADVFLFGGMRVLPATPATDYIVDFHEGEDKISLRGIDAIQGGEDDAFTNIGTAGFSSTAGELRVYYLGGPEDSYTVLAGDINGDGQADFEIYLTGMPLLLTLEDHVIL